MENWNSQCEQVQPIEQTRGLFCMCDSGMVCCHVDVRSILLGQVSLAAVHQIYVFHEAKNGCKNFKIH